MSSPGRGSARAWQSKVYRQTWTDGEGQRREGTDFFARINYQGRRKEVALNTSNREEAGRRAAAVYDAVRTQGWAVALTGHDPERHTPRSALTLGDVVAALDGLRPSTARNYAAALRWWGSRVLGLKPDFNPAAAGRERIHALRLDQITNTAGQGIVARFMAEAGKDLVKVRKAKISLASFLRNARSGFAAAAKAGLELPSPLPLAGLRVEAGRPQRYVSTIDPRELLKAAQIDLAADPDAYACILLALGAGLRRGEIENLTWANVDAKGSRILITGSSTWQAKTDDSSGEVHVSPSLIALLESRRAAGNALGSSALPASARVVGAGAADRAVDWLRTRQGMTCEMPLHGLRKEFGSLICQEADLLTASRQLRHSSLAVTAGVYIESRKRTAPDLGALLA